MTQDYKKGTVPRPSTAIDVEQPSVKNNNSIIPQDNEKSNGLCTISMSQLFDNIYPPRQAVVDNFLFAGTYLFVGAPKVGKSFLMAQLGYSVSQGIPLWDFPTHRGTVLYLALEDNYARLQKRLSTMYGTESTDNFHLAILAKKVREGLPAQLETFVSQYPDTRLIIIDTLKKIRDKEQEQYSYDGDYEIMDTLKHFSEAHNLCLLIVHHTRKQGADDSFETISGSNGLLGAADGAFIMQRPKRMNGQAIIDMVGRDQPDQRLHLEFETDSCLWVLTKAESQIATPSRDPLLEKIFNLLTEEQPVWSGTSSELLAVLQEDLLPNSLTRKLNVSVDRLLNEYGIIYQNTRTHTGKIITLSKGASIASMNRDTPMSEHRRIDADSKTEVNAP